VPPQICVIPATRNSDHVADISRLALAACPTSNIAAGFAGCGTPSDGRAIANRSTGATRIVKIG
jgi:hypothetical protein